MSSEWLAVIGIVALGVYLYCLYAEHRGAPSLPLRPQRDWRADALGGLLEDICDAGDGPETIYIFFDAEKEEFRWSCNAFRLAGEIELCTIAPGGVTKLAESRAACGTLRGMAEAILTAYAKKHGQV